MMTKRILLTGVGGFIGAHTLHWILSKTDWEVVGIESWKPGLRSSGARLQAALSGLDDEQRSRLRLHAWDLTHPFTEPIRRQLFERPIDVIISMASDSAVTKSVHDPGACWHNNCALAFNMLELARHNPVGMFIQVSTDEVYGDAGWDSPGHSEWDTILPSNPYSASKAAQEALAIAYWRTYDVPVVITNTMNVIGEWQDPEKFLPLAIKRISYGEPMTLFAEPDGKTTSRRVWLDAKNMAAALVHICERVRPSLCRESHTRPERFHVIGEQELSVLELAQLVADKLDKPLLKHLVQGQQVRPGYDRRYALVDHRLKSTGFVPPFAFSATLDRILDWARTTRHWVYE
jgi:dTDP-glucose 4,6-dehydratase